MAMDDLYKAFSMFKDGMNQHTISSGINDAQQQLDQLNASEVDMMKRRAAQQQIYSRLAGTMAGAGASGVQLQGAMSAYAPRSINNLGDAFVAAQESGNPANMKYAADMQNFVEAPEFEKQRRQFAQQSKENELNRDTQLELAGLKASGRNRPKQIPTSEIDKLQKLEEAKTNLQGILDQFEGGQKKNVGPWSGVDIVKSWRDPQFADFKAQVGRAFDLYRVAVTGAGASTGELNMLKKNMFSLTDSPEAFKKKLETILSVGQKVKQGRVGLLKKLNFDTGGLEEIPESNAGNDKALQEFARQNNMSLQQAQMLMQLRGNK